VRPTRYPSRRVQVVVDTVVPVFGIVALGWWLGGRRSVHAATLADLALLIASPALVFSILSRADLAVGRWAILAGGTLWIAAATALLGGLYAWHSGVGRGLVLPCTFWNAGNMGLPTARLAFGPEGLEAAAVLMVVMAVLNFSAGIWIAKGRGGLAETLRLPLLWAAAAGLAVAVWGGDLPRALREPVDMLGDMAIPLMLVTLGLQLRGLRVGDLGHSSVAVAVRMGGGTAAALAFVALFGVTGVERKILLLAGVLPSAVVNAVLAQRYETAPGLVASTIVLGTAASLATIPAMLVAVAR